jgi:RNA polymerase sigma-70 factor (ECF subfamily)
MRKSDTQAAEALRFHGERRERKAAFPHPTVHVVVIYLTRGQAVRNVQAVRLRLKCKMHLLQYAWPASEPVRKAQGCEAMILDPSKTSFTGASSPRETETDGLQPHLEHLAVLRRIQCQAMARLYEKYSEFIYSLSLRILRDPAEAEDVLQEVFLRIWRSPDQLKIGNSLLPWIAVVSRNSSIDTIRRRRPSESIEGIALASPYDTGREAEQNLMCNKARALIDELPLEQRTVLEMAYFGGMTHSEIADRTGSPLGTIKTRIRDALKNLRKDLEPISRASAMRSRKT